jgi:hypothetical protein
MKIFHLKKYKYKSALGEMEFENVPVSVPDDWKENQDIAKADYAVSAAEILRMERALALEFFKSAYRMILLGQRSIAPAELKAIQDILGVNRTEFGKLLGLHKASITNLFKGKAMSPTLANLIMERLGMELGRPGSARALLCGGQLPTEEDAAAQAISKARYVNGQDVA